MYEEHFGLKRPPFRITPDTSLFYDGGKRGDILEALVYSVHRGEGIVKVVGEVGSGKTMLCRMLQLRLPKSVEIIYIANPSVSAQDILFVIAHELGLTVAKDASKHEVMTMLQDYLLQRHMEGKQVVLFIEEAQGMPLDTLEEIRLLSNLETDQNKLLQIILFGQPELDENLSRQSIRQLRERITHNFNLSPLSHDEIHKYLNFRMREVGYTGPELVDTSLARKVEQYSGGLLRRINIIADKILLSAFAEGTHNLRSKHVVAAVNDSSFVPPKAQDTKPGWWIALLLVLTTVITLYFSQSLWMPTIVGQSINADVVMDASNSMPAARAQTITVDTQERVQTSSQIVDEKPLKPLEDSDELDATISDAIASSNKDGAEVVDTDPIEKQITTSPVTEKPTTIEPAAPPVAVLPDLTEGDNQWLNIKLQNSLAWLKQADQDNVSIQVLVRKKSAVNELVSYLRQEWPLDLEQTYIYEVTNETQNFYRVYYSKFDSFAIGKRELKRLPESVQVNVPYLQSIYRMQKALL